MIIPAVESSGMVLPRLRWAQPPIGLAEELITMRKSMLTAREQCDNIIESPFVFVIVAAPPVWKIEYGKDALSSRILLYRIGSCLQSGPG